jgi:antitoxin VapB
MAHSYGASAGGVNGGARSLCVYIPLTYPRLTAIYSPMSIRSTLFKSNRSQAVRLPKELAFPPGVKQVAIRKAGKARVIAPADAAWDDFFDLPGIELGPREQPEAEARERL